MTNDRAEWRVDIMGDDAARPAPGGVLTRRQLNRALLARQLLLARVVTPVEAVIAHLVGMQSQMPEHPYIGLWSRIEDFRPEELSTLMMDRRVTRVPLMRATIHLATARDTRYLRSIMQRFYEREFPRIAAFGPNVAGMDMDALLAAGQAIVEREPRTSAQLGRLLAERWPDRDPASMAQAIKYVLPVVQVPPRGVWGQSHQPTWTTIEHWLGEAVPVDACPAEAIRRYLAAFGPATIADLRTWSRLTGLREHVERLRPSLVTYRNERRQELLDVPDGAFVDPATPAPVRFLPGYENALLSHADRSRIVEDDHRRAFNSTKNGVFEAAFLVDGFVAGMWRLVKDRGSATLRVTPLAALSASERAAVTGEAERLVAFLAPGDMDRVVDLGDAGI